jgi:hypothetical protein
MTLEIFREQSMADATRSICFQDEAYHPFSGASRLCRLRSIQIWWKGVTGTHSGSLELIGMNSLDKDSVLETISVDSEDNSNDCILIIPQKPCFIYNLNYSPFGVTGGRLSAVAYYSLADD